LAVTAPRRLDDIEHGFTHFRLRITPVLATVKRQTVLCEPGRLWLTPEDARGAAIPVPVRRILGLLESDQAPYPVT
jgi:A/G-specific adenine glycosylase